MKKFLRTLFISSIALQYAPARAQQTTADKITGIWKGTSLCQQKQSACHDENVVYHISKLAENIYTIQASKVINGAEEDMGTFDSVLYNAPKQTLQYTMTNKQGRYGTWFFKIDGMQMHGTLTVDKNTLFRIIELKKN